MKVVDEKDYPDLFAAYKTTSVFYPVIGAVLEQRQKGLVLQEHIDGTSLTLVISKFGFAQFLERGIENIPNLQNSALITMIRNKTGMPASAPHKIRLYCPEKHIAQILRSFISDGLTHIEESERVQMRLPANITPPPQQSVYPIEQKDIAPINASLPFEIGRRFWDSEEDYLSGGIGVYTGNAEHNNYACVCYSAAISRNIAEIDIATAEHSQKKGHAYTAGLEFIRLCNLKDVIPNWDCFTNNAGSYTLAKKLGFEEQHVYPYFTINIQTQK